ncbi:MAG: hypothetical protein WC836_11940 [Desulfobacula sp.]|jgi:hypothetical protein
MIKDQLPYLGENDYDDGGYVKFDKDFPIQIGIRPNYDEFKKKEFHKMVICAEMLIGLKGLDFLEKISGEKYSKIVKEVQSEEKKETILNNGKFWACDEVLKLLDEMEQTTIVGIKTGKIPFVEYDLDGPPGEFEYHCHGLSFLSWMSKNGYQIPKELSFHEKPDGALSWGDGALSRVDEIPVKENFSIPVPAGTTWDMIKFRIVNQKHIEISCNGRGMAPYNFNDLGFSKKRSLWPLLEQFAIHKGDLLPKNHIPIKANVSELRKHIKNLFPAIEGSPIKHYSPVNGYVCNFRIINSNPH